MITPVSKNLTSDPQTGPRHVDGDRHRQRHQKGQGQGRHRHLPADAGRPDGRVRRPDRRRRDGHRELHQVAAADPQHDRRHVRLPARGRRWRGGGRRRPASGGPRQRHGGAAAPPAAPARRQRGAGGERRWRRPARRHQRRAIAAAPGALRVAVRAWTRRSRWPPTLAGAVGCGAPRRCRAAAAAPRAVPAARYAPLSETGLFADLSHSTVDAGGDRVRTDLPALVRRRRPSAAGCACPRDAHRHRRHGPLGVSDRDPALEGVLARRRPARDPPRRALRRGSEDYWMGAFVWNAEQTEAVLAPAAAEHQRHPARRPVAGAVRPCHRGDVGPGARLLGAAALASPGDGRDRPTLSIWAAHADSPPARGRPPSPRRRSDHRRCARLPARELRPLPQRERHLLA